MAGVRVFRPSERLGLRINLSVVLVFAVFILPWALLALIPDMPPAFLWIFMGINALWLIPTLVLVPMYARSIHYELHDEELVVRRGIITRSEDTVPYAMITNIMVRRGPLDRWLGMGNLHVHTAGFSQQAGAEAKLDGLIEYEAIYDEVIGAARRSHGRDVTAERSGLAAEATDSRDSVAHEILAELRAIRNRLERS